MAKRKPLLRVYRLSVHREGGADITEANVHAPDLREALTMAKQGLGAGAGFAIAPEDYPEATTLGIPFNEADGMLLDPPAPPLKVHVVILEWNEPPSEVCGDPGLVGVYATAELAEAAALAERRRFDSGGTSVHGFTHADGRYCAWCGEECQLEPVGACGEWQPCTCKASKVAADDGGWCDSCGAELKETGSCDNDHDEWEIDVHVREIEVIRG